MNFKDKEALLKVRKEVEEKIGNSVFCIFSNDKFLEVIPREAGKGNALVHICDRENIKLQNSYAFADEENDISMIKAAGLGVGVANTVEAMKAECDVITDADYLHNAVAEVIRKYILSE